jgi:hypothetical protein
MNKGDGMDRRLVGSGLVVRLLHVRVLVHAFEGRLSPTTVEGLRLRPI